MSSFSIFSKYLLGFGASSAYFSLKSFKNYHVRADETVQTENSKPNTKNVRVAVIGSGIGGSSFSYFLSELQRQQNDTNLELDIYERNPVVGGRVQCLDLNSWSVDSTKPDMVDVGATIFLNENKYLVDFCRDLDLELDDKQDSGSCFAFFDEPLGSISELWDNRFGTLHMIKHWGIFNFLTLMRDAKGFVARFAQIYELQQQNVSFQNAIDLWTALDLNQSLAGNGMEYQQKQLNNSFVNRYIYNYNKNQTGNERYSRLIQQLVCGLTRNNYNQNPWDLPPIVVAAAVSTLANTGLYGVKNGGNCKIEQGLIQKSHAELMLQTTVSQIDKCLTDEYIVSSYDENRMVTSKAYDFVIIACPLSNSNLKLNNLSVDQEDRINLLQDEPYVRVYKSYVRGRLNGEYFGCPQEMMDRIETVFSSNYGSLSVNNKQDAPRRHTHRELPFGTCAVRRQQVDEYELEVDGNSNDNEWIIFMGKHKLDYQDLDDILCDGWEPQSLHSLEFDAYPVYAWNKHRVTNLSVDEQKQVLSFVIDDNQQNGGIFYLNALECGLSAQEVLAVSAKNVALLVHDKIQSMKN